MRRESSFLLLLALLIVACGSGQTSDQKTDATAESSELELPVEVDVQVVARVKDRPDVYLLDVREQWEYDEGHIPGVTLLPMDQVPNRLDEIPKDKEVIVTCRSGNRSGQVTNYLLQNGFDNVHNMKGGIIAWQDAGFAVE